MEAKKIIHLQKDYFNAHKTKSIQFRIEQLKKFRSVLKNNESLLYEAIDKDFGKSVYETYETELSIIYHEINLAIKKVKYWSKPKKVKTNLANYPGKEPSVVTVFAPPEGLDDFYESFLKKIFSKLLILNG